MASKQLLSILYVPLQCQKTKWIKSHSIYLKSKVQRAPLYSWEHPSSPQSQETDFFLRYCTSNRNPGAMYQQQKMFLNISMEKLVYQHKTPAFSLKFGFKLLEIKAPCPLLYPLQLCCVQFLVSLYALALLQKFEFTYTVESTAQHCANVQKSSHKAYRLQHQLCFNSGSGSCLFSRMYFTFPPNQTCL